MISTQFIGMMAVIVFLLMVIGIILTMQEFTRLTEKDSAHKGADSDNSAGDRQGHASRS